MKPTYNLSEININSRNFVGGKAASLGEMFNNNFSIPNAFIISTEAFNIFINENNLKDKILNILENINYQMLLKYLKREIR